MVVMRPKPTPVPNFEKLATTIGKATKASVAPSIPLRDKIQFSKYDVKMDANIIYSLLHFIFQLPLSRTRAKYCLNLSLIGDAILWYLEWTNHKRVAHEAVHASTFLLRIRLHSPILGLSFKPISKPDYSLHGT